MRIKLLVCVLVSLLTDAAFAAPRHDGGRAANTTSAQVDNNTYIDANRILMFVTNHGNFGRDLSGVFGYDYGTFFPFTRIEPLLEGGFESQWSPLYAAGLWVGGVDATTGDTVLAVSEYSSEYVPGPMANGTFLPDVPEYRVYKLYRDSMGTNPNQDYLDWPVDQGAPVERDGSGNIILDVNGLPTPKLIGDQMLWSVFNDADPEQHEGQTDAGETDPIGIEVKQTIFGFDQRGPLDNMVFFRLRIYNKGDRTLNNCFFSLWADPDVGSAGDDYVGCDTTIDLGFAYNSENSDAQYDPTVVPCLGFDFFQGPLIDNGDPNDTAFMWDDTVFGMANLGMVSFNKYINGTDPDNYVETYRYMNGLDGKTGDPYVFGTDTLLYQQSGDPVAGTGDLDIAPADRRFMQSTGPITFAPGDSTEIIAAIIVGQGGNNLNSITVMKQLDVFAQNLYPEFNPPRAPARPNLEVVELPGQINLIWDDTSEVDPGDYTFEGYTVWQGESENGPWVELATYDVINDRTALIDSVIYDAELGLIVDTVKRVGKNTGLRYEYQIREDAINNRALRDLTEYYVRVSAFSYDSIVPATGVRVPNQVRFLESDVRAVAVPAAPVAGTDFGADAGSDLDIAHPSGSSGGVLTATVLDPLQLTGDDYRVVFYDTTITDSIVIDTSDGLPDTFTTDRVYWELENVTQGTVLLEKQFNQTGNDTYLPTDGFLLKVAGPAPGFASFQVVANGNGALPAPVPGALHFDGFPTPDDANPGDDQQVGDGHWGFHTADNGGTCGGGTRAAYSAFIDRATRGGSNDPYIGAWDFEMRFTGDTTNPGVEGSYAIEAFNDDNVFWVPFELWRTGVGTPNDPSDDIRLVPLIIDDGEDDKYNLENWGCVDSTNSSGSGEHSGSSLDNDPWTDWVYWYEPVDMTPGEAGYLANEADMVGGTYDYTLITHEVLARTVLINWNGGEAPPFNQGLPETGTIFRLVTEKPNAPSDTFTFSAPVPSQSTTEADLKDIKPVPNPFYLFSEYDAGPGNKTIKFHHMPATATISIYNLGGERVRVIEHESGAIAEWDALTDNGLPVASGIYIYVIEAPGYGQKIGKMAVFTEQEVLQIY